MNAPGRDAWDEWNEDRDDTIRSARSWKYTSPYYTGAHDLDRYGRWVYIPGYDWVWRPAVDPYWAPYRAGRWVWEPYWGWTWVSYEPWGWAPYHYGRWFSYANVWYWWPGPVHRHYRPRWAPAFVTFFGFGAGKVRFSFGFGFGYSSIGWLPVGPCDYYYPWYGRHRHRYNVVHVTNVTNVYNVHHDGAFPPLGRGRPHGFNVRDAFSNPRLRNSITAVGTDDFVRGRIGSRSQRIDEHQLRQAHLVAGSPPVVPTRESLRVSDRSVSPPRGALRQSSERMFARRTPPEIRHSFSENASAMREMVQRIDPARALRGSERGVASADGNRVSQPAAGRPNGTFDGPANSFNSNRSEGAGSRERSTTIEPRSQGEWQRFGGASSNRRDPGNRTDNSRIESGKSSVERPSVTPAPRSGSSREVRPERSREAPSSQRRSVAPAPSRSREESSTPSRRSGSGQNRGPSEPRETVRFMTIPRGDSESSRVGSVRSSGPTVITIPRESNKANDTIAAPRREGPSQSERQFRETPREIPRTTPSFSRSPERNSESQSILRSPRIQRETPRSFQRESPRQYQRESQAQPRLQSSQPRYQASPSYRSSPGGSSYRVQRGGGHSGSFRSSPSSSARSGGASRRGRH